MRVRRASSSSGPDAAPRPGPAPGPGAAPVPVPVPGVGAGVGAVPRPPGAIRRRIAAHPVATDVVVALAAGAFGILGGVSKIAPWVVVFPAPWPWYVLWALASGALLLRRRLPVVVAAVAFAALVGQAALDATDLPWALLIALYSVAAHRGARWAWACSAAVVGLLWALSATLVPQLESPLVAAFGIVVVVLVGLNVRSRRQYLAALIDRAAQLERDRDQEARLAAGAERARIARELHDVVAHGMSVMISLSDGADAVAEVDPARSRDAVRQIGVVGREALADMRRLLGVLHDDDDDAALAPQPGLDELDDLVETYRSAGLPVALTRVGELPTAPALQVVLYRTVQEGLTNSLRYAERPTRVAVVLRGAEGRGVGSGSGSGSGDVDALGLGPALGGVTVEVVDDGAGTVPAASVGTERGLVGLRERAALYGGTLEAGPRTDLGGRGWRLRLALPGHGDGAGAQPVTGASAQPLPGRDAQPAASATSAPTPTDADQLPEEAP
ncbi:histidine kinase [Frigoribacterium sp. PhB116]|uniref:sensor histidine kinase n=1 Tax=Frigoribacterium sp. PhB116 TaxID=2485174 RepID=UPI0010608FC5|nr:histidine kinase [Frigoribacterium sp. PhB116]TDT66341.1 signal transduction histidine kinase [Frigoribacterium sp. PhB116]